MWCTGLKRPLRRSRSGIDPGVFVSGNLFSNMDVLSRPKYLHEYLFDCFVCLFVCLFFNLI